MSAATRLPRVSVVLLNWCAAPLAERCLASLMQLDYPDFDVVLCDNASPDGSYQRLAGWMQTRGLTPTLAVAGQPGETPGSRWVLLQNGRNGGYAAGCNEGIRFARRNFAPAYVWLLNTDTEVSPAALSELVTRAEEVDRPDLVGSTLIKGDGRTTQACGGCRYRKDKGDGAMLGSNLPVDALPQRMAVETRLDWVLGASELVRADYIDRAGLMSEDYFLYCEEMDWALKGRARLAWAPASRVRHDGGGSTPSALSAFFFYRNALRFTWRYFPAWTPLVYLHLCKRLLKAAWRGDAASRAALASVITFRTPPACAAVLARTVRPTS